MIPHSPYLFEVGSMDGECQQAVFLRVNTLHEFSPEGFKMLPGQATFKEAVLSSESIIQATIGDFTQTFGASDIVSDDEVSGFPGFRNVRQVGRCLHGDGGGLVGGAWFV
jgi:hypothetical protein